MSPKNYYFHNLHHSDSQSFTKSFKTKYSLICFTYLLAKHGFVVHIFQ